MGEEEEWNIADVVNRPSTSSATSKDSGIIASFKKNVDQSLSGQEEETKMLEQQKKLERETSKEVERQYQNCS